MSFYIEVLCSYFPFLCVCYSSTETSFVPSENADQRLLLMESMFKLFSLLLCLFQAVHM